MRTLAFPAARSAVRTISLAACSIIAISQASAQTVSTDQADADPTSNSLQDIVVTARRKAENLRDVPISVVAMSGASIAQRNIVQQEDLSVYIPNFRQTNGSIGAFRFVRGAGSGSNRSFDQAVGSFFDGVYAGRGELGRMPFFTKEWGLKMG